MFDGERLRSRLPVGWIGEEFHYFQTIGSTNEQAIQLFESGAAHGTLILSDAQTAGKGREGRNWITRPGTAIAFSLILRPSHLVGDGWMRLYGFGALGLTRALDGLGLKAAIKWPNDVLLSGKKVAGILLNNQWLGEKLDYSVLGMGVNITPASVPEDESVDFPAISVETTLGCKIEREDFFLSILTNLVDVYARLDTLEFVKEWESRLAYLGQEVVIRSGQGDIDGRLVGLSTKGQLKMVEPSGEEMVVEYGDIRLRPKHWKGS